MLGKAKVVIAVLALASPTALAASNQEKPQALIVRRSAIPGRVIILDLGLHFATAIRMSEPVSSVVAGDPALFKVEHSEREPRLVFVKPLSLEPAQSNLLISTVGGRSVSLLVRTEHTPADTPSNDAGPARPVHFLLDLSPAAGFLIDEAAETSMLIEQTVPLARAVAVPSGGRLVPGRTENTLNQLLTEQEFTNLRVCSGVSPRRQRKPDLRNRQAHFRLVLGPQSGQTDSGTVDSSGSTVRRRAKGEQER